ncbi:MAG: IS110 family transposase [Pseudomonadales bacterium]|nr:IS110 family transposase [Pseudomonadales bacterium]
MDKRMTIGIDLAKNVFYVVALGSGPKPLWRKKLTRAKLSSTFAQLPSSRVALEACGGAHYWARTLGRMDHEVVILPPQHVKGYARGQKNDYNDAQAIAEACMHGRIRPVKAKGVAEQDLQSFHQMRGQVVSEQTRLINQVRGLLAEYGVVIPQGKAAFAKALPLVLAEADNELTPRIRELLHRQWERFLALRDEVCWFDHQLTQQVKDDELCQRLMTIPGFGPVVSSAFRNLVGDGSAFDSGRGLSAAVGLVPRQSTTGGKTQLLGITKKGDKQVRSLVVHGARSVLQHAEGKADPLCRWAWAVKARRGYNKAVVALANKLVRIAWAVVARGECYQPRAV